MTLMILILIIFLEYPIGVGYVKIIFFYFFGYSFFFVFGSTTVWIGVSSLVFLINEIIKKTYARSAMLSTWIDPAVPL